MIRQRSHRIAALKSILTHMAEYICVGTTSLVVINGTIAWVTGNDAVSYTRDLLLMPLIAAFSCIPLFIYVFLDPKTTRSVYILRGVQLILTLAVVFLSTTLLGVMERTGIARLAVMFVLVFVFINTYAYLKDKRLAKLLNSRLDAFHNAQNATYNDMD